MLAPSLVQVFRGQGRAQRKSWNLFRHWYWSWSKAPGWLPMLFLPTLYLSIFIISFQTPVLRHYRFGPGRVFHLFKSVKDCLAYGWFCSPCTWAGLITSTAVRCMKADMVSYLGEEKANNQGKFWKRRISRYLLLYSIDKDLLGSYICQSN